LRELVLVSLAYVLGFLLLNQSLGRLQASFSETVRGLEPLTSFLFVRLFGARGSQIRPSAACALLMVLGGAALSVWAQPAFDVRGLVYGLLANCAFSSRALLVTTLQDVTRASDPLQPEVDSLGLFVAQHLLGLVLLAPLALASEGTSCAAALAQSNSATITAVASSFGFLCYNFLSLYVLLLLDAVAHSVCNTCRRAVTIVAAAIIFSNHLSAASVLGIALIISGAVSYAILKDPSKLRPPASLSLASIFALSSLSAPHDRSAGGEAGSTDALLAPDVPLETPAEAPPATECSPLNKL